MCGDNTPGSDTGNAAFLVRTIIGYETMNMIHKGQVNGVSKGDIVGQVKFIADIFGVVA